MSDSAPAHFAIGVTIGIPAYNASATLDETLRSVMDQTYPHFEVIIVDDGSTDDTAAIAQRYVDADARFRLIGKPNGGVATARNVALAQARESLFANLDADDLWHPDMLARQVEAMAAGGDGVVLSYTWFAYIDARSRIISIARPEDEGDVIARMCRGNLIGNGSSAVMRTAVLRDVGGWEPAFGGRNEDYDAFFALAERGRFALIRAPLLGYRQTLDSGSSNAQRMVATYDIVARKYAARHPEYANEFAVGRQELIAYLFDKALLNRRWRAAFALLRAARDQEITAALRLVKSLPAIICRILLPLSWRARLRTSVNGDSMKGTPYLGA